MKDEYVQENPSSGGVMSQNQQDRPGDEREGSDSTFTLHPSSVAAWEQIENGRYRPRRIRGSCRGRELG